MVRAAWAESLERRVLLSLAASDNPAADYVPMQWQGHEVHVHPGRWIITMADSTAGQTQRRLRNAGINARVQSPLGAPGLYSVAISPRKSFRWIELKLGKVRGYRAIEPDFAVSLSNTAPNDSQYPQQWSLNNTGQTGGTPDADIDAPEAWDITTGDRTIVVAVVDTGVDYTHQDLAPNLWTNDLEIADDGLDNDGNGYIDDVRGWDFANDDNDPMDDYGHGTHVAGVLAAATNNSIGIAGGAWNVKIMPLKFMSSSGTGEISAAVAATNYITAMRQRGVNVLVSNNSWGDTTYSESLRSAILSQLQAGILFVAAAGNTTTNIDSSPFYPAAYNLDNIISVAATTHTDARASFSNYGKTMVDLGAPGDTIRGTAIGGGYRVGSGTSYAAPLVSAVAALAYSISPGGTPYATVRSAILNGGDLVSSLQGSTVTGRRLNAYGALMQLPMAALASTPASNALVATAPVDFDIHYSHPVDPGSIAGDDLSVNGIPAASATLVQPNTVRFHFDQSPVSAQGTQSMAIAAGAILRAGDGAAAGGFNASFRYDSLPLAVEATIPADGAAASPPLQAIDVVLSEPIDPATVSASDLSLSPGSVTSVTLIDGRTLRFAVSGLSAEANVAVSIPAGAFLDLFGNPSAAYAGAVRLDIDSIDWPSPVVPAGEPAMLAWRSEYQGLINAADDVDELRIRLEAGADLSLVARPAGSLVPHLVLIGPGGEQVASSTPVGRSASLACTAAAAGEYRIAVSSEAGSAGEYTLSLLLGATFEGESIGQATNDLPGQAQPIQFFSLPGGGWHGAVVGRTDVPAEALATEIEPNNARDEANSAALNFAAPPGGLYQLSIEGMISLRDNDWYDIGTLDVGDVLTVSLVGKDGGRGVLSDPSLELHREENGQYVSVMANDDWGAGADSLIYRLTIETAGRHLLRARAANNQVGAYDVGVLLENAGAAPATGGTFKQEPSGYNDLPANANDASASWRPIAYDSTTAGTITAADADFYSFPLRVDDRITFLVESDGPLDAKLTLRDPSGNIIGKEDGSSVGLGSNSAIYAYRVPLNGTHTVEVAAAAGTGDYRIHAWLSTATAPAQPPVTSDWYSVDLAAGEPLSAWVTGALDLAITDASGTVLAESATGRIDAFTAPEAGSYRLRIQGARGVDYTLMALRSAQLDAGDNDTFASAQPLAAPVLGEADGEDWYRFPAVAGQAFQVRMHAPASAAGLPDNTLSATLELYDPSGALVAAGTALGDGAVVTHVALADGEYRVRIAGAPGGGVYVLSSATPAALISGTEADDVLLLRLDPTGAYRLVYDNATGAGEPKWAIPAGLFSSLRIEGQGGDDRLIVDYANGNPMPPDGLTFDGGWGDDRVEIGPSGGVGPAEDAGPLVIDDFSGTTALVVDGNRLSLPSPPENLALALCGNAVVDLPAGATLSSLRLDDQARLAVSGGMLVLGVPWQAAPSLDIAPGAKLELNDQVLILRSSDDRRQQDLDSLFGWLATGRAGGTWQGDGIASHAVSIDPRLTLGLFSNAREDGSAIYWSIGSTWLDANSILVRPTWLGDLDVDGVVGPTDYFQIDSGFLRGGQGYSAGDADYSGAIDADDYFAIDQAFLAANPPFFT